MGLPNNLSNPGVVKSGGSSKECHPSAPYETSSDDDSSISTELSITEGFATTSAISTSGYLTEGIGNLDISDSTNTHIGTSVNAQDTHIGPRISAGNVNIIMAGSDLPEWTNDVVNTLKTRNHNKENPFAPGKMPYTASEAKQMTQKPIGFSRRRVKVITVVVVTGAILVTSVTAVVIWWLIQGHESFGPHNTPTYAPINETTTTLTPHTYPIPGTPTIPTASPSPAPIGSFVTRDEWHGKDPPPNSARNFPKQFENVLVDNLHGSHCSTIDACSKLLQKIEDGLDESIDFNFLIDDTGRTYEARGWDYSANTENGNSTIYTAALSLQIALIGDNSNDALTEGQEATIKAFISNSTFTRNHVRRAAQVRGQCVMNINNETGPDLEAMCYIMKIGNISNPCIHSNCSACKNGNVTCK